MSKLTVTLPDDLHQQICDAREQLEGDEYSRMLVMTTGPIEGDEIFHTIDQSRDIAELFLVSDILITDYSSVMFDYSILNRPMFFLSLIHI